MNDDTHRNGYHLVDATVGTRLVFGFIAPTDALQRRLPWPWEVSVALPRACVSAVDPSADTPPKGPNLLLVFNDLLLNQDKLGRTQHDATARYLGINIAAANPRTGERGIVHFRIFTGNPLAVPGRYHDAQAARVRHESSVIGVGTSAEVREHWRLDPESGGSIHLDLTYDRGPLTRLAGDQPDFPVWAAADTRILRIYQEDTLFEVIHNPTFGVDRVRQLRLRVAVPEFSDIFTGAEQPIAIYGNPHYTRRVFSPDT